MREKIIPFVEVTCSYCGGIAPHSGFYYRGIIADIREATKDWVHEDGTTYCPTCWARHLEED